MTPFPLLNAYEGPLGHSGDSIAQAAFGKDTDPDVISNNAATYRQNTAAVNRAFGGAMTQDQLRSLQNSMTHQHANQSDAISYARWLSKKSYGFGDAYDPAGGKNIGSYGALTKTQVQSLINKIKGACD